MSSPTYYGVPCPRLWYIMPHGEQAAWQLGVDQALHALTAIRCTSCDHTETYHDVDGQCWFTTKWGKPEANLVCPCHREGK